MQASEWDILDKLYVLALSTAAPAAVMVPILYWRKGSVPTTDCVLQVTAIALLLGEVMLSRAPFVSYHLQVKSVLPLLTILHLMSWGPMGDQQTEL